MQIKLFGRMCDRLGVFTKTVPSVTIFISLVYLHNFVFGHNIPWIETNYRILDIENTFIPHKLDYWYLFKVISHCPVRYALSRPLPILDMMKNIAFFGYIINHVCYLGILVCKFGFILVSKSLNLLNLFRGERLRIPYLGGMGKFTHPY